MDPLERTANELVSVSVVLLVLIVGFLAGAGLVGLVWLIF